MVSFPTLFFANWSNQLCRKSNFNFFPRRSHIPFHIGSNGIYFLNSSRFFFSFTCHHWLAMALPSAHCIWNPNFWRENSNSFLKINRMFGAKIQIKKIDRTFWRENSNYNFWKWIDFFGAKIQTIVFSKINRIFWTFLFLSLGWNNHLALRVKMFLFCYSTWCIYWSITQTICPKLTCD